jgi:ferrous iron transport protein B
VSNRNLTIAIAGNPNSGKTTIFNDLTGTRQHVGNYPGVTVEKKQGIFSHRGIKIDVVDLPGTYSLQAASLDEKVARDFMVYDHPDVIVDVVDASNFERHMYLTAQLLELGVKLVVVLNMSDHAKSHGQLLDVGMIKERLSCEVVETVGSKGKGIEELKDAILRAVDAPVRKIELDYGEELYEAIEKMYVDLRSVAMDSLQPFSDHWISMKLIEGDEDVIALLKEKHPKTSEELLKRAEKIRKKIEGHHGDMLSILFAERRYGFAKGLYREVVRKEMNERRMSDSIDNILTHRVLGLPIFLVIMYAIFYVTFTLGEIPMTWIERGVDLLGSFVSGIWPGDGPIKSLVVSGIIDGVGGVIVFMPNIVILFAGIAIMEDTGYMARIAFIMDGVMHRIGLHGKSFIPMLIGFGCSVPAIMATRTLEHRRDRLATMFVIPLMSCGAKLPIYALFIPAFFPVEWRPRVLWLVYLTGILFAIGLVRLLRSTWMRGESMPFVMELPPYRMPTVKGILIHMWERSWLYLKKAGTIILGISIIMWFLTSYPKATVGVMPGDLAVKGGQEIHQTVAGEAATANIDLEHSYAGQVGRAMEPVMRPLGFDWRINTALLGAFAAKEVFVSQLSIIFSLGDVDKESFSLRGELKKHYNPLIGLCVMIFCLISAPCMATFAMTRRESGSTGFALLQFVSLTFIAYVVTLLIYQVGGIITGL